MMRRDVFQAVNDPRRSTIITLETMTPNALAEHFITIQQAVSKHLKCLMECQLINQEVQD